jgi:hypothetical protein
MRPSRRELIEQSIAKARHQAIETQQLREAEQLEQELKETQRKELLKKKLREIFK